MQTMMQQPQRNPNKTFFEQLISSGVKTFTLSFTCNNCGHKWQEKYGILSIFKFLLVGTKCPNCHKKDYNYEYLGTLLSIAIGMAIATLGANIC